MFHQIFRHVKSEAKNFGRDNPSFAKESEKMLEDFANLVAEYEKNTP